MESESDYAFPQESSDELGQMPVSQGTFSPVNLSRENPRKYETPQG